MLFRLEGALQDNKELQFDLTFSVLTIAIAWMDVLVGRGPDFVSHRYVLRGFFMTWL